MSVLESQEGSGALSPRSFALQHARPRNSFVGCSRISDYEVLGKLGEGTFGYVASTSGRCALVQWPGSDVLLTLLPARSIARAQRRQANWSPSRRSSCTMRRMGSVLF